MAGTLCVLCGSARRDSASVPLRSLLINIGTDLLAAEVANTHMQNPVLTNLMIHAHSLLRLVLI